MTDTPFQDEPQGFTQDLDSRCDAYFHGLLFTDEADALLELTKKDAAAADAFEKARRRFEALRALPSTEPSDRLLKATLAHVEQGVVRLQRRSYWRKVYLGSVGLAAIAAAIIIGAFQYHYKNLEPSPFDLRVLGQTQFLAGGPASFRLGVFDRNASKFVPNAPVKLTLVDAKRNVRQELASFKLGEGGSAAPPVEMPDWEPGKYDLEILAQTPAGQERLMQPITLERSFRIMLSTDKPVYKPGQTIRLRGLALRKPDLKPYGDQEAVFTLIDPVGNLIFKHRVKTSEFGLCSADCALADEIEEGGYKAAIQIGDTTSERTIEVQRYVLPKFKIETKLDKTFYAPGDNVKVDLNVGYFFGQPVAEGTVKLRALSDAAGAQEIASAEAKTDAEGKASLTFKLPDALVGTPQNNGDAKVQMFFTVTDTAGQTQNISASRTVTSRPLQVTIAPEAGQLIAGVINRVYAVVTYADGRACAGAKIKVNNGKEITANELGVAVFESEPPMASGHTTISFTIEASDAEGHSIAMNQAFLVNASFSGMPFILRLDKAIYSGGDTINLNVIGSGVEPVFIDFIKDGQTQLTTLVEMNGGSGKLALDLPPEVFGTLEVVAYRFNANGFPVHQVRPILVQQADGLKITATLDRPEYLPGADAKLRFQLTGKDGKPVVGALSLAVVDEAVFSVLDQAPGMEQVFFLLEQELLKPVATLYTIPPTPNGFPGDVNPERLAARRELEQAAFSLASWINNPAEPTAVKLAMPPGGDGPIPEIRSAINQTNPFSINLESYTSKEAHIELVRKIGIERIMLAWICLVSALILTSIISFAVMQPRAFLITSAVGLVTCLLVSPVIAIVVFSTYSSRLLPSPVYASAEFSEDMPRPMAAMAPRGAEMEFAPNAMPMGGAMGGMGGPPAPADMKMEAADPGTPGTRGQPPAPPRIRRWFPETLLWRPELVTDENGVATLDVAPLADSITTWRLSASAVSKEGSLGAANQPIKVFQTFFVDVNTPVALTRNDQVGVPIVVYNYLNEKQTVSLDVSAAGWFERTDGATDNKLTLDLGPGEVRSLTLPIRALHVGKHELQITATGGTVADAIRKEIEVDPEGKKYEIVSSGTLTEPQRVSVVAPPEAIPGSVKAIVKLYPSSFSQLVEGLDSIFQMPSGCFEQTSSTTYPNILALDYLRRTKKSVPEVEAKARQYIHLGYQRLLSFEIKNGATPSGGFDWFGNPPANRVLTAYGLMEFEDMAKVHDIDPNLIARTRQWLLAQRQPDGTWKPDHGLHEGELGAGYEQQNKNATLLTTAYVAWAVFSGQGTSDSGSGDHGATAAYLRAQRPESIEDPYTLAVVIAALASIDDKAPELNFLAARLDSIKKSDATGKRIWWEKPGAQGGEGFRPFYASGDAANVETTAMAALALLKVGGQPANVRGALTWLVEKKDGRGTWHSTQATILALKALLAGTGAALGGDAVREIEIALDGVVTRKITIPVDQSDVMQFIDLSDEVASGKQTLSLKELTDSGTIFQVVFRYHAPEVDQELPSTLAVDVEYDRAKLKVDDLVTAKATVTNRGAATAPMIMVDLPIPPGFAIETDALERLQDARTIAKYQLTPRQAIIYLRELPAGQSMTIEYKLKATMPVKVQVPAAEVYEYYDPAKRARGKPSNLEADAA